jgi:diguanylate cyclase (GGDEF)-like protein
MEALAGSLSEARAWISQLSLKKLRRRFRARLALAISPALTPLYSWLELDFDKLTGLPVHHHFVKCLRREVRSGIGVAVIAIDCDNFKNINDVYGHEAGNQVLVAVAKRLQEALLSLSLPGGFFLARMGNRADEFGIIIPAASDSGLVSFGHLLYKAVTASECETTEGNIRIRVSVGCHWSRKTLSQLRQMTSQSWEPQMILWDLADQAMYKAKAMATEKVQAYLEGDDFHQNRLDQWQYDNDLARAVDTGAIGLVRYQPIVDAASGKIVGFELLMGADEGQWVPQESLEKDHALLEASGYGLVLFLRALEQAACHLALWNERLGHRQLYVSINGPADYLNRETYSAFKKYVSQNNLAPGQLAFELVERGEMRRVELLQMFMDRLRMAGMRVFLDDFGTKQSNLDRLVWLKGRIDAIKVDKFFVDHLNEGTTAEQIVGLLALGAQYLERDQTAGGARGYGVKVIAEGVETADQADQLRRAGCDYLQGKIFYDKLAVVEIADLDRSAFI